MKKNKVLKRSLGVQTWFASRHGIDECGDDGLPLTPYSINILGRFQKLLTLSHENLCQYVEATSGKHERVYIVSEFYETKLGEIATAFRQEEKNGEFLKKIKFCRQFVTQALSSLKYLHLNDIVHRSLSPEMFCFDANNNLKIFGYGMYYITSFGKEVPFPLGLPEYMAPEILSSSLEGDQGERMPHLFSSKVDVWSLGMIILEFTFGKKMFTHFDNDVTSILECLLSALLEKTGNSHKFEFSENLEGEPNASTELFGHSSLLASSGGYSNTADGQDQFHPLNRTWGRKNDFGYNSRTTETGECASPTKFINWEQRSELKKKSGLDAILKLNDVSFENLPGGRHNDTLLAFLRMCLMILPEDRPTCAELLSHPFITGYENGNVKGNHTEDIFMFDVCNPGVPRLKRNKPSEKMSNEDCSDIFCLDELNIDSLGIQSLYYFWKLAGGDIRAEVNNRHQKKQQKKKRYNNNNYHHRQLSSLISAMPPVSQLPLFVKVKDGLPIATSNDNNKYRLYDPSIIVLSLETVEERLKMTFQKYLSQSPPPIYQDLENDIKVNENENAISQDVPLPFAILEKDIDYQFHRIHIFKRALFCMPYSFPVLLRQAKKDIPPFLRGDIWAGLLKVTKQDEDEYSSVDQTSPHPTDKQIDVDVPRCHQYDQLLSSPVGHQKLRTLLKTWVVCHAELVYWQGLDSLAASLLHVNFNNEARAFACLQKFISKYLSNFFLPDNSLVIQEYLLVFTNLIVYHYPILGYHLAKQGFTPELYAIPWFLTMFTHVFSLDIVCLIWDWLLTCPHQAPLFFGLGMIEQFRNTLLNCEFNECILFFSDMPEINVPRALKIASTLINDTPRSITELRFGGNFDNSGDSEEVNLKEMWWKKPIPLEQLRNDKVSRITVDDVLKMEQYLLLDVRDDKIFSEHHWRGGLHINARDLSLLQDLLIPYKGGHIVILSGLGSSGMKCAWKLVKKGYSKISVLKGSIDAARAKEIELRTVSGRFSLLRNNNDSPNSNENPQISVRRLLCNCAAKSVRIPQTMSSSMLVASGKISSDSNSNKISSSISKSNQPKTPNQTLQCQYFTL